MTAYVYLEKEILDKINLDGATVFPCRIGSPTSSHDIKYLYTSNFTEGYIVTNLLPEVAIIAILSGKGKAVDWGDLSNILKTTIIDAMES